MIRPTSALFIAGGYFFGKIPFVEKNIGIIVPALGVIVAIPLPIQVWQSRKMAAEEGDDGDDGSENGS